jgi:hypothetical protein
LNIDGEGFLELDGISWGDRYLFTTTGPGPATRNSSWSWVPSNNVPFLKEWLNGPLGANNNRDATHGIVQTQRLADQDAGGGRYNDGQPSMTDLWQQTSPPTDGCAAAAYTMPCVNEWPYQAYANSIDDDGSNNARMAWKTQYGFIGQTTYNTLNGIPGKETAPGYPKKSYSTYIVFGTHTSGPVEAQIAQVEVMQNVTFTPAIGTVVTSGPGGVNRVDAPVTYSPAGYNHVYGALAFNATGNQIDIQINVAGATPLKNPLIILSNYTAGDPQTVKFAGQTLVADRDYFASPRATANELWLTLARNITGNGNRLEVTGGGLGAPVITASAVNSTRVNISWAAVAGAANYEIHRSVNNGGYAALPGMPFAGTSYNDDTVTANNAYLYKVKSLGAGGPSAFSNVDVATTIFFTDDPLAAGTAIKAVHATQLRSAANALRASAGLGAYGFTDAGLAAGTVIKEVHLTQLRTAINEARAAAGLSALIYVDPAIGVGVTPAKAVHITNLRDGVK